MGLLHRQGAYVRGLFKVAIIFGTVFYLRKSAVLSQYSHLDRGTFENLFTKPFRNDTLVTTYAKQQSVFKMFDETWKPSFVSPEFHPHYNVNCSALGFGNKTAVDEVNVMLDHLRRNNNITIPTNGDVRRWTHNCAEFKKKRAYQVHRRSQEESEYPIAYIILTHKDAAQTERLLRAIYEPQNIYCIHPDGKASSDFIATIYSLVNCFQNIFIPSKVERIMYRGITRLLADINCMRELLVHPTKWTYVINLCGQDFPLKTNLEITRQLKAFKGKNDVEAQVPSSYIAWRTKSKYTYRSGYDVPINTGIAKSPPPNNITIYFGNAYVAVTRAFVDFALHDREAIELLEWFSDTWSPGENFWATLHRHPRAPGGIDLTTKRTLVRMMRWGDIDDHPPCQGRYVHALCVFGIGYLNYLTTIPHLFANKFHYSFDPVNIQCLEEMLDYRANFPQATFGFIKDFPAKIYPWYNDTTRGIDTIF